VADHKTVVGHGAFLICAAFLTTNAGWTVLRLSKAAAKESRAIGNDCDIAGVGRGKERAVIISSAAP
jgi:hypothetical protein